MNNCSNNFKGSNMYDPWVTKLVIRDRTSATATIWNNYYS